MELDDAFPPGNLDEALARNPDADRYMNKVVERSLELGRRPSWKHVAQVLQSLGVLVGATENPVKRVYRQRGGWDA